MIKVIELFAGIGSQHSALKRLGIEFEVIGISEIDKYAIKSYEAIHGKVHNYGDISKIERLDYADFWTYSFPCQDLSVAGKQKGLGEGTRSGLLYEVERLLDVAKENDELPKYLMLENVKNLVGKKFKGDFDRWIGKLNQLGYNTYWKVLNAKHYGVPQNRERVFAISIRKDIDNGYQFPEPFESDIRLKDILEEEVDEKFYISNEKADKLLNSNFHQERDRLQTKDHCDTLLARDYKDPKVVRIGNIYGESRGTGFAGNVWDKEHLCPTITTMQGGNREPMIIDDIYKNRDPREYKHNAPTLRSERSGLKVKIPQATTKGYIECSVPGVFDMTYPDSKTRRGRVQDHGEIVPTLTAASQDIMYVEPCIVASRGRNPDNPSDRTTGTYLQQRLEINKNGISNTITSVQKDNYALEPSGLYLNQSERFTRKPLEGISRTLKANQHDAGVTEKFRIRKLTPKECFRLMGFTDEEFHKAEAVNSNSQLYKQAGNSIVVDVLYYLFKNLFVVTKCDVKELENEVDR